MFVDFPAFDDNYQSHCDILVTLDDRCVAREKVSPEAVRSNTHRRENGYRRKVKLNGIIYTHRITDDEVSGPVWKNPDMFGRSCGDRAAGGVQMLTTMWDQMRNKNPRQELATNG